MKIVMLFVLAFLASWALQCKAMNLRQQNAVLDDAKEAFTACANKHGVGVSHDGQVVCLRGTIDSTMFVNLMKTRSKIKQHPYVVVSGAGGYLDSSIDIVQLLDEFDPTPVVGDMCASACAQFLFLMGNQRVMLHCADIAIHGGPVAIDAVLAEKSDDSAKQESISDTWRFKKFYKNRHINMDMVTKPPADIQKQLDAGKIVFWPWTINQLRGFGVKGIISDNDPNRVVPKDFGAACIKPPVAVRKSSGT